MRRHQFPFYSGCLTAITMVRCRKNQFSSFLFSVRCLELASTPRTSVGMTLLVAYSSVVSYLYILPFCGSLLRHSVLLLQLLSNFPQDYPLVLAPSLFVHSFVSLSRCFLLYFFALFLAMQEELSIQSVFPICIFSAVGANVSQYRNGFCWCTISQDAIVGSAMTDVSGLEDEKEERS